MATSDDTGRPRVYLAGPLGFFEAGRRYHEDVLLPAVERSGFDVLDPWPSGAAILDDIDTAIEGLELIEALAEANHRVGAANAAMIRAADAVLAMLDGSDVDSGTAAEIGYAAALERPIVGVRSDFRLAGDNIGTLVNLQVGYFISVSGGVICDRVELGLDELHRRLDPR